MKLHRRHFQRLNQKKFDSPRLPSPPLPSRPLVASACFVSALYRPRLLACRSRSSRKAPGGCMGRQTRRWTWNSGCYAMLSRASSRLNDVRTRGVRRGGELQLKPPTNTSIPHPQSTNPFSLSHSLPTPPPCTCGLTSPPGIRKEGLHLHLQYQYDRTISQSQGLRLRRSVCQ